MFRSLATNPLIHPCSPAPPRRKLYIFEYTSLTLKWSEGAYCHYKNVI